MDLVIGGIYEHFKGRRYLVKGVAKHSESLEEHVVYQTLYGDFDLWIRPKSMFLESVEKDGTLIPRFAYTDMQESKEHENE